MSTNPPLEEAAQHELKRHAVGTVGIVFFVVAAAAPLAATVATAPITFGETGRGAPGAYLIYGIILLFFAAGYAAMSRHVTSAAGFAAYIEQGLGRIPGFAGATLAVFSYTLTLLGVYGAFGYFTNAIVKQELNFDLPWYFWSLAGVAVAGVLGYLEIDLSAKILGVLMVAEMSLLVLFDIVAPARGGASGVSLSAFIPGNVFAGAVGVTILFASTTFIGFEATAIYGEEAREPRKAVPRATYTAVAVVGAFYTITMWAIGLAYKAGAVQSAAVTDPANFVFNVNTQFVGKWSTDVLDVLVITSYFATLLAFHNTLARYLYSLARGGVLPSPLRETHPRWRSPHVASIVITVTTVIVVAAFAIGRADPFLVMFSYLAGLGTIGILVLEATTSISVVVFFRRKRSGANLWSGLVAPLLGAGGITAAIVLGVTNWKTFTGATGGLAAQLPWLLVAAAFAGVVLAWVKRGSVRTISTGFKNLLPAESPAVVSGAVTPTPAEGGPIQ